MEPFEGRERLVVPAAGGAAARGPPRRRWSPRVVPDDPHAAPLGAADPLAVGHREAGQHGRVGRVGRDRDGDAMAGRADLLDRPETAGRQRGRVARRGGDLRVRDDRVVASRAAPPGDRHESIGHLGDGGAGAHRPLRHVQPPAPDQRPAPPEREGSSSRRRAPGGGRPSLSAPGARPRRATAGRRRRQRRRSGRPSPPARPGTLRGLPASRLIPRRRPRRCPRRPRRIRPGRAPRRSRGQPGVAPARPAAAGR